MLILMQILPGNREDQKTISVHIFLLGNSPII